MSNSKSLNKRFNQNFAAREKLDREYWNASDKLQDEHDKLMKELNK